MTSPSSPPPPTDIQVLNIDQHLIHSALLESLTLLRRSVTFPMSPEALRLHLQAMLRLTYCLLHSPIPSPIHSEIRSLNQSLQHDLAHSLKDLEHRARLLLSTPPCPT